MRAGKESVSHELAEVKSKLHRDLNPLLHLSFITDVFFFSNEIRPRFHRFHIKGGGEQSGSPHVFTATHRSYLACPDSAHTHTQTPSPAILSMSPFGDISQIILPQTTGHDS